MTIDLVEVFSYSEDYGRLVGDISHFSKLTDLNILYRKCQEEFGGDPTQYIHSTRLAQKLQLYIPTQECAIAKGNGEALLGACHNNNNC